MTKRCEFPYENGTFLRDDCVVPLILPKTTQVTELTANPTTSTYTHIQTTITTTTTSHNEITTTSISSVDSPPTTLVHQQPAHCPIGLLNTAWSESLGCIWASEEHG